MSPEADREFGFEFGKPYRWQDEFPQFAAALGSASQGARVIDDGAGRRIGIAMSSVQLADGPRIGIMETLPFSALVAPAAAAKRLSLAVGVLAVLAALAVGMALARSLTRPLVQMTAAAEGLSRGQQVQVPAEYGAEIGMLARTFKRMLGEAEDQAAALAKEAEGRRRTQAALEWHANRERLFSAAVQSSVDAILTETLDGVITGWNPAAERLFGFTADEAIGKSVLTIVPEDRRAELQAVLGRIRRGEIVEPYETVRLTKDRKPIDVSLSVSAIKSGGVSGLCVIARDVTEKKRLDRLKDEFVSTVSHELRTPLTSISGSLGLLMGTAAAELPERTRHLLALAQSNCQRLVKLVCRARL